MPTDAEERLQIKLENQSVFNETAHRGTGDARNVACAAAG